MKNVETLIFLLYSDKNIFLQIKNNIFVFIIKTIYSNSILILHVK